MNLQASAFFIAAILASFETALAQAPVSHSSTPAAQTAIVASFVPAPGSRYYNEFREYVLPHIDAVMVRVDWKEIETAPGKYDFTSIDDDLKAWPKVVLIVSLVSDAITGHGPNRATPAWVLAKTKIATCPYVPSGVPVAYDPPYVSSVKALLAALLQHLDGNPKLLYLRVGFVEGGENSPLCSRKWPGFTPEKFLAYIKDLSDFVAAQHVNVLSVSNASGALGNDYADAEADIFHSDKIGIGMQNLAATDELQHQSGKACNGNWCAWAKKYPMDFRYAQARVRQPPEALPVYVRFAEQQFNLNALELFSNDLLTAYDPKDANYQQYGKSYRDAIGK
jgi:hypothetical protein